MTMNILENMLVYICNPYWRVERQGRRFINLSFISRPGKYIEIVEMTSDYISVSIPLETGSCSLSFNSTMEAYEYLENFILEPIEIMTNQQLRDSNLESEAAKMNYRLKIPIRKRRRSIAFGSN
jgi:hypothetical protein